MARGNAGHDDQSRKNHDSKLIIAMVTITTHSFNIIVVMTPLVIDRCCMLVSVVAVCLCWSCRQLPIFFALQRQDGSAQRRSR